MASLLSSSSSTSLSVPTTTDARRLSSASRLEKMGYLTKQGAIVKSWKRRWFVLRDTNLYYYRTKEEPEPAGVIELDGCTVNQDSKKTGKRYAFEIVTNGRNYYLFADNNIEMEEWIKVINSARSGQSSVVPNTAPTVQLHVKGMMCARCAEQVKRTIEKTKARQRAVLGLMDWHTRLTGGYIVQSVTDVTLDHEEQLVTITGKVEIAEILGRLEEAGFIPSIV